MWSEKDYFFSLIGVDLEKSKDKWIARIRIIKEEPKEFHKF